MENIKRKEWLDAMLRIVSPVLHALEKEELHTSMPLDFHGERADFAPLEAFGRSMLGLAPWLEAKIPDGEEKKRQEAWRETALRCIDKATDPASADFMIFSSGGGGSLLWIPLSFAMPWCVRPDSLREGSRNGCGVIWHRRCAPPDRSRREALTGCFLRLW